MNRRGFLGWLVALPSAAKAVALSKPKPNVDDLPRRIGTEIHGDAHSRAVISVDGGLERFTVNIPRGSHSAKALAEHMNERAIEMGSPVRATVERVGDRDVVMFRTT